VSNGSLNAYLKHGHHLVKGWLQPGAAHAIVLLSQQQRSANLSGGAAEIGVHHGKLLILLYLLGAKAEPAVAIDLFSHQHLNVDRSGAGNLDRFKRNLRRHADLDRLVIHEGDSTLLTAEHLLSLGRGPFRLFSIDGGHTAEITAHDLSTAEGALAEGGIVTLFRLAQLGNHGEVFERRRTSPLISPCVASSRSSRRMILPDRVLGSASVKRISSGRASEPISFETHFRSSSFNCSLG
jgi:hypothetical protein